MTIEERKKGHRELWTWLGKNPDEQKSMWPGWERFEHQPHSCFLCEEFQDNHRVCTCPIKWIEEDEGIIEIALCPCERPASPYQRWELAGSAEEKATLAFKIADMWE